MRGTLSPLTSEPSAATEEADPEAAGEAAPLGATAAGAAVVSGAAAGSAAEGRLTTGVAYMLADGGGAAVAGGRLQHGGQGKKEAC